MHGAPGAHTAVCSAFRELVRGGCRTLLRAALVLAVLLAVSGRAMAQSGATTTTWAIRMAAGSRCTGDPSFVQKLRAQLPEEQRASEDSAELVAEIAIDDKVAHIRVFDRVLAAEAGARELPLEARHCIDIADAVSLVVSVLVEAGRGALSGAPAAVPEKPAPQPREQPKRAAEKAPAEKPERPSRPVYPRVRPVWRGPPAGHDLLAAAGIDVGLIEKPVLVYTFGWGIRPAKTWPIWLQASGWNGADATDDLATLSAVHGGILTCPLYRTYGRFRLRACAGFQAGAVFASGRMLPQRRSDTRPLALASLELAAHMRIAGPLEFVLLARGDALLMRSRFYYTDQSGMKRFVYDPSVVVGGPFAGLALKLR